MGSARQPASEAVFASFTSTMIEQRRRLVDAVIGTDDNAGEPDRAVIGG